MKLILLILLVTFQAKADQASDLVTLNKCFDNSQKLSASINHRRRALITEVKLYRKKNNRCIELSKIYENRYEHLRILDEIEEEMEVAR